MPVAARVCLLGLRLPGYPSCLVAQPRYGPAYGVLSCRPSWRDRLRDLRFEVVRWIKAELRRPVVILARFEGAAAGARARLVG